VINSLMHQLMHQFVCSHAVAEVHFQPSTANWWTKCHQKSTVQLPVSKPSSYSCRISSSKSTVITHLW